ncbi:MAG TPA: sugar ABC transporter permease [Pseudonocardiaceae bacterium]|jgi:putative chitobiose transport system permease protein
MEDALVREPSVLVEDRVRPPRPATGRRTGGGTRPYVPYLFLLPGIALFGVFFAWPAVLAVETAFTNYSIVNPTRWVGLANFTALWHDAEFHGAIVHSFIVMLGLLPFSVIIPISLAVLVNRAVRGIQFFRALYFLPVVTSMVAVAVAWNYVFDDRGVLNWILERLHVTDGPIHFLLDQHWALASVIVVEGWKGVGTYMMIFLAGLQSIPGDLHEAAQLDGASAWQRFSRITVPLLRPYIAVAVTIELVNAMQVFTSVYVLTQGGPGGHTETAGYFVWSRAFQHFQLGYASASGIVIWVILVVLALVNYRITNRGEAQPW